MQFTILRRIRNAALHPLKVISYVSWRIKCRLVTQVVINSELFYKYMGDFYPDHLNHGNAMSYINDLASKWCVGTGIDIGADNWPLAGAIPIQNNPEQNAYRLDNFRDASLDYVFSSHCLEHLENWQEALRLWISKLKPNGILFLYLPHESMKLWLAGGPWGLEHKWRPTLKSILPFLSSYGIEVLSFNDERDSYWSFHIIGKRVIKQD
jgi:SAM-dependent methyltransferase